MSQSVAQAIQLERGCRLVRLLKHSQWNLNGSTSERSERAHSKARTRTWGSADVGRTLAMRKVLICWGSASARRTEHGFRKTFRAARAAWKRGGMQLLKTLQN